MEHASPTPPLASVVDDWGRWLLRTYFVGSIACMVVLTGLTLVADVPGPRWLAVLLPTLIVPVPVVLVALVRRLGALRRGELTIVPVDPDPPPGFRGALSQMRWLLATVVMFGAWPGFYYLASHLGQVQAPTRFHFDIDDRVPMVSPLVLIYVTIYWFFIFPALYGRELAHFHALLRAYGTLMLICTAVFAVYPVEYPRDPLVVRHFGDWVLAFVRGVDPPINCFPSSHCAVVILSALALREVSPSRFLPGLALALGICAATILTKQHYVIDTVAGMALGAGAYLGYFKPELRRFLVLRRG